MLAACQAGRTVAMPRWISLIGDTLQSCLQTELTVFREQATSKFSKAAALQFSRSRP